MNNIQYHVDNVNIKMDLVKYYFYRIGSAGFALSGIFWYRIPGFPFFYFSIYPDF